MIAAVTEQAYFVLADISGYTAFLARTELEHANGVLSELISVVNEHLSAPLRFVELEGDAVFAYAPAAAFADAERLAELLEVCYVAFRRRQEEMQRGTTCTCSACANMGNLNLKFVVHLGAYVLQATPGGQKPIGPDVILVHRLLKNRVVAATGFAAYALFTDAVLERTVATLDVVRHAEEYEEFGQVAMGVLDLGSALARLRDQVRVRVEPGDADLEVTADLPVPKSVAWEYLFDPAKRLRWQLDARAVEAQRNAAGRSGVGWESHCDHGKYRLYQRALDWRPFDYLTLEVTTSGRALTAPPPSRTTLELSELPGGRCRLTGRVRAADRGLAMRLKLSLLGWAMRRVAAGHLRVLVRVIEEDLAARGEPAASTPVG